MSSDNKKTDEYWMGVRDALRMVDSFNKWANRNPGRAKSLEDFIYNGLIAAAKRCESCLRENLGLSFVKGPDEESMSKDMPDLEEEKETHDFEATPDYLEDRPTQTLSETSHEMPNEKELPDSVSEIHSEVLVHDEFEESPPSIDSVVRLDDETLDIIDAEGPPRDFTTDFTLVEPTPLTTGENDFDTESSETIDVSSVDDDVEDTSEIESKEDDNESPAFTWSDYEAAVTPSSEPEPPDTEIDVLPPMDEEEDEISSEDIEITEPPEPPKIWSPYDEPSITEDEPSEDSEDRLDVEPDEPEIIDAPDDEVDIKEPPPPPPPESEEDEEERRRRARRLFFGA